MGQRHQVYFRLPPIFYSEGNRNNRPERTIGYHVQFSYGTLPIRNLLRVFDWVQKAGPKKGCWSMPFNFDSDLQYVQAFDAVTGMVSRYHPLGRLDSIYIEEEERGNAPGPSPCDDPRLEDNNDGITVVDMVPVDKGWPPTYCMMSVNGWDARETEFAIAEGYPYSAKQYLDAYIPKGSSSREEDAEQLIKAMQAYKVTAHSRLCEIFPKWLGEIDGPAARGLRVVK